MKNTISLQINALREVFILISKGNFLKYFIPGIIVTLFFLLIQNFTTVDIEESSNTTGWFSSILSKISTAFQFVMNQLYIFIILTVLSPINTMLSEKLDTKITGQKFKFSIVRLINDLIRMIFIVIIALILQLVFISLWWILARVLSINDSFIYTIVTFIISSFFFGFSFFDHSLERHEISVSGSIKFAFSNKLTMILTGAIFNLLYYFPYFWKVSYFGIIIAPVITTMVATIVYLKIKNQLLK